MREFTITLTEKEVELLQISLSETGLNADYSQYDGGPMQGFGGRRNGANNFRYDSWRVPMNIALDYEWSCADREWQQQYGEKIQNFFYSKGINDFVDHKIIVSIEIFHFLIGLLESARNNLVGFGGLHCVEHKFGIKAEFNVITCFFNSAGVACPTHCGGTGKVHFLVGYRATYGCVFGIVYN